MVQPSICRLVIFIGTFNLLNAFTLGPVLLEPNGERVEADEDVIRPGCVDDCEDFGRVERSIGGCDGVVGCYEACCCSLNSELRDCCICNCQCLKYYRDAVWTDWTPWSCCTASCGGGTRTRTRGCTGKVGLGADCTNGSPSETENCFTHDCRTVACVDIPAGNRRECGPTTEADCTSAGCCWASDGSTPSCYVQNGQYLYTGNSTGYLFAHKIDKPPETTFVTFKVDVGRGAAIGLATTHLDVNSIVHEVIINEGDNGAICLASGGSCLSTTAISPITNVIQANTFRDIWISWGGGTLSVGSGTTSAAGLLGSTSVTSGTIEGIAVKTINDCGVWGTEPAPVASWNLNAANGGNDLSQYGENDLSLSIRGYGLGPTGEADGVTLLPTPPNEFIKVTNPTSRLRFTSAMSFYINIYLSGSAEMGPLFEYYDVTTNTKGSLWIWDDPRSLITEDTGFFPFKAASVLNLNAWNAIAVVWEDTLLQYYVDGTLVHTVVQGSLNLSTTSTGDLHFGYSPRLPSLSLNGRVECMKFFDVTLTATEIAGMNCERRCTNANCLNGGICQDRFDGYECMCKPGFTGIACEVDIDDCEYSTCKNGASCKDGINTYVCDCEDGFEGDDCDISVDSYLLFSCDIDETVAMLDLQKGKMENILPRGSFTFPRGLTYDRDTDSVYVIDGVVVWNISLAEPSAMVDVTMLTSNGRDIALNSSSGWFYASTSDYKLDGVDANGILQISYSSSTWYGLGFDNMEGYLYYTDSGLIKRALSADINNSQAETVVDTMESSLTDVHIDSKRDLLFWCTYFGKVYQSTTNGTDVELILQLDDVTFKYMTGIGRHLYISGYNNGAGAIFDIYNGSYTILHVSRPISPFGIVAFSKPAKVCPFVCENGGTMNLETCVCVCPLTWKGDACDVPPDTRDTELLEVWPNFGPEAGGTAITVTGKQFPYQYPMTVNIGHILCNTTIQNSTTVIAITPSLVEPQIIGADLAIYLTVGNINLNTPYAGHTFTYKGNPVIDDVYPKESIVKGGTKLTANGNNLDSVSVIVMDTTMVHRKRIERVYNETIVIYNTNCDTQNRTQMLCPTPAIELPDEFKNTFTKNPNGDGLKFTKGNDTLQFYIGFRLDGVQGYENFTSIEIFAEPFFRFKSKYIFKENTRLQFEGDNLDQGIRVYDYTITIGMEDCGRLELTSNSLSCLPPQEEPPKLEKNLNFNNPRIVIHAGLNIKHAAGHLEYPDSALPWYILYIVVPVCGVIIIVITIVIIVVCCKRRNRTSRANQGNTKRNGFKNNAYSQND